MKKPQKIEYTKGVAQEIAEAEGIVITTYKGLKFAQMDNIRRAVKGSGNDFRVIKNTLLRKALAATGIEGLDEHLLESTALIVVREDFSSVAKEIKKFSKDYKPFQVKAGYLEGRVLNDNEVMIIADLPSREELLAKVLSSLNAPVQNTVSLLANIPRSLMNVLVAIQATKDN